MQPTTVTARARRRAAAGVVALAGTVLALLLAGCGDVGSVGYVESSSADREAGKRLFVDGVGTAPSCGSCHALADAGTTGQVGPDLDAAFRQALADGITRDTVRQVVRGQIQYPISETSTGAPGMPGVDVLLPECRDGQTEGCVEDQRQAADDIAAYVAAVAAAETPSPAPPPAPPPEEGTTGETTAGDPLAEGRQVFASAGCGSCHALADAGSSGTVGPDLDASQPSEELVVDRVTNGRGAMPPFRGQLSEEQISAVAEYVAAVAGS